MSYNVGQFRSFDIDIGNYLTDLNIIIHQGDNGLTKSTFENIQFKDAYTDNINLTTQNNYYSKFKIKKMPKSEQTIYLKAKNSNREQILGTFNIANASSENEEEFSFFEIVFSVNDNYNLLVWQLARTFEDYAGLTQDALNQNAGRMINVEDAGLYIITDLLANTNKNQTDTSSSQGFLKQNFSNLQYLNKIGIQGPPLMLMSINKQQIRIGKNGIYELNNGINVTSIGFVPKQYGDKKDFFIMDFEYQAINPTEDDINNNDEQEGE